MLPLPTNQFQYPPTIQKLSIPSSPLFRPCPPCPYYKDLDNFITKKDLDNFITKGETYPVKSSPEQRQRLDCQSGSNLFSEMADSPLFERHSSLREYVQTAKLSTYGPSTDQVVDVLEHDARTILQWQTALGQKRREFHLALWAWLVWP